MRCSTKRLTKPEVAQIIEGFLAGANSYPQQWNDFVEVRQTDEAIESFRRRCYELDPLVNRPGDQDSTALVELRSMVEELRR